jgi:hypothetical protein
LWGDLSVKKQILNFGFPATHASITALGNFGEPVSVSDFDTFVFEPLALHSGGLNSEDYTRRQNEVRDLVAGKGGVIVCPIRPNVSLGFAVGARAADSYGILDLIIDAALGQIRSTLRRGAGSHVEVLPTARGASAGYFRVLTGALSFAAYLDTAHANLVAVGGTVFAVDSVSHPIGVEFAVGAGRVCFVPVPDGATGDRVGSAIVRVVEAHYGGPGEIEAPPWSVEVAVPGATAHDGRIDELERERIRIETETSELKQKRADLLNFRVLLYGYGKSLLEPVVRSALRLLGFEVPEPDTYMGQWDFELRERQSSKTAIGEIEGSDGVINVDKYRQLLDYFQSEVLEGRVHKGILVGDGYRQKELTAAERHNQFSEPAIRGAKQNGFCLVPATELFKAVCAVLESADNEGLRILIRESIISTVGVWAFARETSEPAEATGASAALDMGSVSPAAAADRGRNAT